MPAIFGHQHACHHRFSGKAGFDQMLWRALLHDLFAGPAGELRTMRDDHAVLRRHHIEPLRSLLADGMHGAAAAGAIGLLPHNRPMNARQVLGQRTALLADTYARQRRLVLFLGRFLSRVLDLQVFQCQLKLVGRKLFELLALGAISPVVGLVQKMVDVLVEALQLLALGAFDIALFDRCISFGDHGVALGQHLQRRRAQCNGIGRKRIRCRAHATSRAYARCLRYAFLGVIQSIAAARALLHGLRSCRSHRVHAAIIQTFQKSCQLRC